MLEIAAFRPESVCIAQDCGADRVEFCAGYEAGGTTPSLEALINIRDQVRIPVFTMIRPRGGNFVYTASELEQMKTDIRRFKLVADGFVFGLLDEAGQIDVEKNEMLVSLANPKPCTFHRAFDEVSDLRSATETIIQCGFRTILTSGGHAQASAGIKELAELVDQFHDQIDIMPGGGIRCSNIEELKKSTGSRWFHSAAITGKGELVDGNEVRSLKQHV
jgi:copper homeostasis protein